MKYAEKGPHRNHQNTSNPPSKSPTDTWVFSGGKKYAYFAPTTKWVERVATTLNQEGASNSKQFAYSNNYQAKHPMTKTQWRGYQRQKKADALKNITNVDNDKGKQPAVFEMVKRPATERIFPPLSTIKKDLPREGKEVTSNFTESEPSLDIMCNVVSVLPVEYDVPSEIDEVESDFTEEMAHHKPLCYYVMNNGCVKNQHVVFEKPECHTPSSIQK